MNWIFVALSGQFLNAVAYLTNKFLLNTGIPSPFVYAFLTGALGMAGLVLVPFGFYVPTVLQMLLAMAAGAVFILALIFFYAALKENEASRVVPFTGGFVPFFTFILAYIFLSERLGYIGIIAFSLLVAGGVLITLEFGKRSNNSYLGYLFAITASLCFAVSAVMSKQVFDDQGFVSGFVWSRIGGFAFALLILLMPKERKAVFNQPKQKSGSRTFFIFIVGQIAGALGFVLINYAISVGPVSLVNATQGAQYGFLLLMIIALSKKFPKALSEKLSGAVLAQKIIAIALITIGIGLIAF